MKPINRQIAIALVEQCLQDYRKIAPNMPEEAIVAIKEIPYGWYFTIGLKNPSCSNVYFGAYSDYIVDRDYRFLHVANSLDVESEIAHYGKKRLKLGYRMWWKLAALIKTIVIKGQLYAISLGRIQNRIFHFKKHN
jgi:hypothetical protein